MELLDRIKGLSAIIGAAGGEVIGKKKLQKLTYLAQEKGLYLGYDYIYHFHGVYSPALEADTHIAKTWGVLAQDDTTEPGNPVRTRVLPGLEQPELSSEESLALDHVKALCTERARVLEVLSTIVFLTKMDYAGATRDDLLLKQKGHLEEYFVESHKLFEKHFPELNQA